MSIARKSAIMIGAAFMSCGANAASLTGSSPGFHYFYRQGETMEQHDEAIVDCAVSMRALANGGGSANSIGLAAGIAGGFAGGFLGALIGGAIDSAENRQGNAANMENCMAVKNWSVVGLSEKEGKGMESPEDPESIRAKLTPFIANPASSGPVLRGPFANELAVGDFKVGGAESFDELSMSMRAVKDRIDAAVDAAGPLEPPKPPKLPKGVRAPKRGEGMKASILKTADERKSYIVMRIVGDSPDIASTAVTIERLNADGVEVVYDGLMVAADIGEGRTHKGASGANKLYDHVIEIPPGLWKIAAISKGNFAADLCFGAPSFEMGAGEAIYLGAMSVGAAGGYPIAADLAVAKEILAANPLLAEKVKAAEWTNGFTSDCFGSYAYAYEIPGAPFVDMNALARAAAAGDAAPPVEMPVEGEANPDTNSLEGGGEQ